jgi:hypothetical protein
MSMQIRTVLEVRDQRIIVGPHFVEEEPQRVFAVDQDGMTQAGRFGARSEHVIETRLLQSLDVLAASGDAAGDDDHAVAPWMPPEAARIAGGSASLTNGEG